MNFKNIFVLFSPGSGGHHVSNLISTCDQYLTRATAQDYQSHGNRNAHFDEDYYNYSFEKVDELRVRALHLADFMWNYEKIKHIPNRQILLIKVPSSEKDTLAYRRYHDYNTALNYYYVMEQELFYSQHIIEQITEENDFHELDPKLFFCDDIGNFIDFVHNNMGITLDTKECELMHKHWIANVSRI